MESGKCTREYLTIKKNFSTIIDCLAAQVNPREFATKLNEVGLVTRHVVEKASVPDVPSNHFQDVVDAVLVQINLDSSKYHDFIRVLKGVYPLLAANLTREFGTTRSEVPEVDGGATGGTDTRVQPLATMSTSAEVGTLTKEESWDLSVEFAFMISKLYPLMDEAMEVEAIKRFLRHFCDMKTGQLYVEPSIYQHCTSTAEVLEALFQQRHFHAIQLGLLGTIVGKYGCGESKRLLQEYESKVPKSAPLKRLRNELTDEEIQSSYGTKRLKVKINGDSETVCLEDVKRTQEALERSSEVRQDAIVFAKHEPGSVILTFIVPACTVESFTNISKGERKLSDLAAMGILSIKIDQVTIHTKAHIVHQKLQDLSLEETEAAHPTPLKPSTLKPTPSSEGTDSGGVGDPTEEEHFLPQLTVSKEKLPRLTHPSSTPAVEKPWWSRLWSAVSSLKRGTADPLTPTPSSEGTDSGGVGDPTLPKKEIDPAVGRLLQGQQSAQAMKLKPHPVGSPFEETLLPGMSGEEELFLQQLALRKEKLPQFTHPSSTPALEKPVRSMLWSTRSSLPISGDEKAMSLAEKMLLNTTHPTEHLIDCSVSPDGAKAIAEALRTNTSLKALDLSFNEVGDDGVQQLAESLSTNNTLEHLFLSYNHISSKGAASLAGCLRTNTSLKKLDLRNNKVGDDGVQQLAESLSTNNTLEDLNLDRNHISSKGAASLAGCLRTNTSLKTLDLWGNEVGDDGVQQLAESLSTNTTLEYLDLGSNHISSKGAASLAGCLHTNTSLKKLDLRDNEVGDDGVQQLAESLSTNNTLEDLDLDRNHISSKGAASLAVCLLTNASLKTLDLRCNEVGDDGVQQLAESLSTNNTLKRLDLSRCPHISEPVKKRMRGIALKKGITIVM